MKRKIILAGGSGFLGTNLIPVLISHGYEVVVLSRSLKQDEECVKYRQWDGKNLGSWVKELEGAYGVVNLTGKSVNCRYTDKNKKEIIDSRVDSVNVLAQALNQCKDLPKVWIQTSSLAIYGDAKDRICDEETPKGEGFSSSVCEVWEDSFNRVKFSSMRKVTLRIGLVFGAEGGVLAPFANIVKWFLGGTIGDGEQYISWIHVDDMNEIFMNCLTRDDYKGIFNITSPNPVTNREFMFALRKVFRRPWAPPTSAWMVRFGTFLLRTEAELVLTGRRGHPAKLLAKDFHFQFPYLEKTLENLT